jgi:GT2 family glycosyltransferase
LQLGLLNRLAWRVVESTPGRWRASTYRVALSGLWTLRLVRGLFLSPRYYQRRLLYVLSPGRSLEAASGKLPLSCVVVVDAGGLSSTSRALAPSPHEPGVHLCQLPDGGGNDVRSDLSQVCQWAMTIQAEFVALVADPDLLDGDYLSSLSRLVFQNSGFEAWMSGATPGYWSWNWGAFGLDPQGVLLIRRELLEAAVSDPPAMQGRHRRNAQRLLSLLDLQLDPRRSHGRHVLSKGSPRLGQLAAALPLARPRPYAGSADSVTVVLPTRDRPDLVTKAIEGLARQSGPCKWNLLIVDNQSLQPATKECFERLLSGDGHVRILSYPHSFNFAAICNLAVASCSSPMVLLLNNDVVLKHHDGLQRLIQLAQLETVGCVGAGLFYPDGRVQHLGIELCGDLVAHQKYGERLRSDDPLLQHTRQVAAVTGACMAFRRSLWQEIGGFDENLPVDFNDVDFCLKSQALGYANLICPTVHATHLESESRGREPHPTFAASLELMLLRWGKLVGNDPYALRRYRRSMLG